MVIKMRALAPLLHPFGDSVFYNRGNVEMHSTGNDGMYVAFDDDSTVCINMELRQRIIKRLRLVYRPKV